MRSRFLLLAPLLASPLPAASSAPALSTLTYSGDQQVAEDFDRELSAAGGDAARLAVLEERLFAVLRGTDATFAARQAAAQRLGLVLAQGAPKTSAHAFRPLGAMLVDARDSDLARLALEPVAGPVVDGLFVAALEKSAGRARLGVIDSIARRRIAAAVSSLAPLLKAPDAPTVAAAARALGAIADDAAVAALRTVPEPSPVPVAEAKLAAAARVAPETALPLLAELQRDARSAVQRTAAFRLSLDADPATAAARIATALGGNDWDLKQVALESLAASRAANLVSTLTTSLREWDSPTQVAVIAALARRGEKAAVPTVVSALEGKDADVRLAAIEALGQLPGTRETATVLARLIASPDATEAKSARQSLARMNGPDVSAAILAGAERGEPAARAVYMEQLALRGMTEGLPILLKCRIDPNPAVRAAAVGALGELAPFSEQKAILDWTIEAKDGTEQTRALRALVNVTLRGPNPAERGRALYSLIEFARPELALRLLPALPRVGGAASADCAGRLAVREDPRIAEAATDQLVRWSDATALPALVQVAEKAALPASRTAALEGALRQLERGRTAWKPEATGQVKRLIAASTDADLRKNLVLLLHRASDADALALAESLKGDATLGAAAAIAVDVIRANQVGEPTARASKPAGASNVFDRNLTTRWNTPLLGEEWIEVDLRSSRPIQRITLDQFGRDGEFPEKYEVCVSNDPQKPGAPLASGAGKRGKTVIDLPAGTRGRYLTIRNTAERADPAWSVSEIYIE